MIRWHTTGRAAPGRFTVRSAENPALEWATGVLSGTDQSIHAYMESAKVHAQTALAARSRVDTGLMRAMADSLLHVRRNEYELTFGWWEDAPYYAPFQEFGTVNGIRPMLAVQQTFFEVERGLRTAVVGPE